jgi:hypothetical protein
MNHSVKSDEELIALLQRTMHKVSVSAPEMKFTATAGDQRWMASAAAATVLVAGLGAVGIALNARHNASSPLSPGAQATTPVDTAEPITSTPVIDGIGTYGSMTLADHSIVAVGVTDGGGQACLLTDWALKVCDPLPTPVSPSTIPFAHVVQSTLGQPARHVIWGVIQAGFTAVLVNNGVQTPVVLSPQNGNGLSGFAQSFESTGAGAQIEIRDSNGAVVQTTAIAAAPTTSAP